MKTAKTKRFELFETRPNAGMVPVRVRSLGSYGKLAEAGRAVIALDSVHVEVCDSLRFQDVRWDAVAKAKWG